MTSSYSSSDLEQKVPGLHSLTLMTVLSSLQAVRVFNHSTPSTMETMRAMLGSHLKCTFSHLASTVIQMKTHSQHLQRAEGAEESSAGGKKTYQ